MVTIDEFATFVHSHLTLILIVIGVLVAICILGCLCKVIYPIISIPCKIAECIYKLCNCMCRCCCKKDNTVTKQQYYEPI